MKEENWGKTNTRSDGDAGQLTDWLMVRARPRPLCVSIMQLQGSGSSPLPQSEALALE